ncbi:chemotaxis protein CheY [beta proteobacterium AAP51]|nr:chemotaxis protein CheY [beta proteobacterium AAP51]
MHAQTVFIVDDDAAVRDAMSLLLSLRGHASACFASAEDFLSALQPGWRGCVVADIRMSGMTGLELQAQLRTRAPQLPVIVITAHGDVNAARQAFLNQAVDFIEKPFDGEQLLQAIARALGRASPAAAPEAAPAEGPGETPEKVLLSPREFEVMELLVRGLHNRAIADELGISHRTVEVHKARVLDKLNVRNVVELVRLVEAQKDKPPTA